MFQRRFRAGLGVAALLLAGLGVSPTASAQSDKPNIQVINPRQ